MSTDDLFDKVEQTLQRPLAEVRAYLQAYLPLLGTRLAEPDKADQAAVLILRIKATLVGR